mgnify:CR=1 FL=1
MKTYITGSRQFSNIFWALAVTIGGYGFFLTGLSSYFKVNFLLFSEMKDVLMWRCVFGLSYCSCLLFVWAAWLRKTSSTQQRMFFATGMAPLNFRNTASARLTHLTGNANLTVQKSFSRNFTILQKRLRIERKNMMWSGMILIYRFLFK